MTTVAVIPARYASARFPGKPLANETGKYLIQHVYERASQAKRIDRVIVGTDDARIVSGVASFGGEVRLTRDDHPTGTARVAEVMDTLGLAPSDVVLNVQGDEPELDPKILDELVVSLEQAPHQDGIATLAAPFDDDGPASGPGSPLDPNCVKVVVGSDGRAMYFSRSLIPYPRDTQGVVDKPSRWLLHLGVYAFRVDTLRRISGLRSGSAAHRHFGGADAAESLEQLDWLERGLSIRVVRVAHAHAGVDTPDEYAAFVRRMNAPVRTRVAAVTEQQIDESDLR